MIMCDSGKPLRVIAYKLRYEDGGAFCAFRDLDSCLKYLKEELEYCKDYAYVVEPYETTEEELGALPDFDGDFS
jgi:hypothetical protein